MKRCESSRRSAKQRWGGTRLIARFGACHSTRKSSGSHTLYQSLTCLRTCKCTPVHPPDRAASIPRSIQYRKQTVHCNAHRSTHLTVALARADWGGHQSHRERRRQRIWMKHCWVYTYEYADDVIIAHAQQDSRLCRRCYGELGVSSPPPHTHTFSEQPHVHVFERERKCGRRRFSNPKR